MQIEFFFQERVDPRIEARIRDDIGPFLKNGSGDDTRLRIERKGYPPDLSHVHPHRHFAFQQIRLLVDQIEAGTIKSDILRHPFQDEAEDLVDFQCFHQS